MNKQDFNKKCLEFLGYEYISKDSHAQAFQNYGWWVKGTYTDNQDAYNNPNFKGFTHDFNFCKDWNLIMEVIEVIEKLELIFKIGSYWITIETRMDSNMNYKTLHIPHSQLDDDLNKKEATIEAINQFLIWYKQNK